MKTEEMHQLSRGALAPDLVIEGLPLRIENTHLGLLQDTRAAKTHALLGQVSPKLLLAI